MEYVTSHIPYDVVGATDAVADDEVPFVMGDIITLASLQYSAYADRCTSSKPNVVMTLMLNLPLFW